MSSKLFQKIRAKDESNWKIKNFQISQEINVAWNVIENDI